MSDTKARLAEIRERVDRWRAGKFTKITLDDTYEATGFLLDRVTRLEGLLGVAVRQLENDGATETAEDIRKEMDATR